MAKPNLIRPKPTKTLIDKTYYVVIIKVLAESWQDDFSFCIKMAILGLFRGAKVPGPWVPRTQKFY